MTESAIRAAIRAARKHWAFDEASITLIAARENKVYRVVRPDGPVALRVHRKGYRSINDIHSELMWMDMLAAAGIAVPKPVKAIDGTTVIAVNDIVVDMLSWLDGTPLSKVAVTEDHYYELGRVLAQMHVLVDAWQPPDLFSRPTWELVGDQPSWDKFWENPGLSSAQKKIFQKFRATARHAIESLQQPDYGLIHADLVPDNVLTNGTQLQLIDFDDGGYGYRLFDLATITHRSRRNCDNNSLAQATIAGYCSCRDLDQQALPLFEALRACSYVGWNISRLEESGGHERNARFIAEAETSMARYM